MYTVQYPDCDIKILELVDQQWSRRYQGGERVAVGQTIPESSGNARVDGRKTGHDGVLKPVKGNKECGLSIRIPRGEEFYAAVIKAHTAPAYRYRFCINFGKSYCIVAATTEPNADGVLLIKIDWENGFGGKSENQRKEQSDELMRSWKEVISLLRCEIVDVAHRYLSGVTDDKREREGVKLGDCLG